MLLPPKNGIVWLPGLGFPFKSLPSNVYFITKYLLMIEDQSIVDRLKQNDLGALEEVYLEYKKGFFLFARTFSVSEDDIADVYQETIISLYENVGNGRLSTLTSSLKTYLFAIGRFKLYKQMGDHKKTGEFQPIIHASEETLLFDIDLDEQRKETIKKALDQLGGKCQRILEMFYYRGMTLDEVQRFLDYSTKDVLKNQKSRCLKKLRESLKVSYE